MHRDHEWFLDRTEGDVTTLTWMDVVICWTVLLGSMCLWG